ncbi:hypothetical protein VPH35_051732 [Triticum aestivum]
MSSQSLIPSFHTKILCTGSPTVEDGEPLVVERGKGCRDGSSFTCPVSHPIADAAVEGVADLANKPVTLHQVCLPVLFSDGLMYALETSYGKYLACLCLRDEM